VDVRDRSVALPKLGLGEAPLDIEALMAEARAASDLLKALSHEARLVILCLLTEGEKSVSDLEALLAMPQAAVSQHLARLRYDNLVATRRDGRMIYYSIADGAATEIMMTLKALFCRSVTGAGR
jgi:DNA-binding transcriptional ArsR family regulator